MFFCIKFPFPIHTPIKLEYHFISPLLAVNFFYDDGTNHRVVIDENSNIDLDIDISFFLVEQSTYYLLDDINYTQTTEPYTKYQQNCIFYSQNSNQIDVAFKYQDIAIGNYIIWRALDDSFYRFFGFLRGTFTHFEPNIVVNWIDKFFKAHYISTVDGRTKIETLVNKYDGDSLVDQYNGAIDLNKMGVNLLGLSQNGRTIAQHITKNM